MAYPTEAEFLAQYQLPEEERKRLLLGNFLLGIGGQMMTSKRGNELGALGSGAVVGAQMGQQAVQDAQRGQMDKMKLRQQWQEGADKRAQQEAMAALSQRLTEAGNPLNGMPSLSPTNENVASIPKSYETAMKQWQIATDAGDLKRAEEYRKAAEFLRVKYGLTPQTLMRGGKPVVGQTSETGDFKELAGYAPKPEFQQVGTGKETLFYDPVTQTQGGSFAMQTTPGQDQSAALQRAQMAQTERHWQAGQGAASKPQIVNGQWVYPPDAQNPTGRAVTPAGLQAPDKQLTAEQGQASMYLGMMKSASADIEKIKQPPVGEIALARGDASYIPKMLQNWVASPDAQKYAQSSLQWTEAMLRITTGATAPPEEVARTSKTFFPQIGDTKEVIEQKNAKRKQMEEFVRIKAGSGAGRVDSAMANQWSITEVNP